MKKIDKGVRMTKEELVEVNGAITALLESLSHYTSLYGIDYWKTYEEYDEFNQKIADACNIIEKEIAKKD